MPEYPIDLGRKHGSYDAIPELVGGPEHEYYPSTRFEWESDYEMPEEGTITLRYRVTRDVVEKVPKEKNCVDIDFLEIVSVKADKTPDRSYDDAAEGLDKLRAEMEDKYEE